jgi:VWFA-related protein
VSLALVARALLPSVASCYLILGVQASGGAAAAQADASQSNTPTFRSGVDVIAVDVQVVRGDGSPVASLTRDGFDVAIDGKRHDVVSAEFVSYAAGNWDPAVAAGSVQAHSKGGTDRLQPSRLFILAIDALSFGVGASRGVAVAAQNFVDGLPAADRVGVFTFPLGPKLDPTPDRIAAADALNGVVGQREMSASNRFNLSFAELVDAAAGDQAAIAAATARECGGRSTVGRNANISGSDPSCRAALMQEASSRILFYEAEATTSLTMLRSLVNVLATLPDRKVIILISAGTPISDRPGGRPDVGNLPILLGEDAAKANAIIYTMFLDSGFLERFSAETRKAGSMLNVDRDSAVAERWLDQFSGSAGGTFVKVLTDNTETAFDRILHETSGYYLLGIRPELSDRDGRPHKIRVTVRQRGVVVRSRQWVIVPALNAPGAKREPH